MARRGCQCAKSTEVGGGSLKASSPGKVLVLREQEAGESVGFATRVTGGLSLTPALTPDPHLRSLGNHGAGCSKPCVLGAAARPGEHSSEDRARVSAEKAALPRANVMSGRTAACRCSGPVRREAAHLESDQHANTSPAGEPGRRSKETGGSLAWQLRGSKAPVWGVPLLSPKLGRTQPWSQHPTLGFRECLPFYQVTKQSLAPPGAGDEVREVRSFF